MTAASAKAKANAMIKSQAFKSKGVASLSRRERLGSQSSPAGDYGDDGNFAFDTYEDPSARSVVSVKARQSKASGGKGLFRYGGGRGGGGSAGLNSTSEEKRMPSKNQPPPRHVEKAGDGNGGQLPSSPTSSGGVSIAGTITNTPPSTTSAAASKKPSSPS